MIKITKEKLTAKVKGNLFGHKIEETWPKDCQEMSLIRYISEARRAEVSEDEIQWTLWKLDHERWDKAEGKSKLSGEGEGRGKEIVDTYLELFGGADDD